MRRPSFLARQAGRPAGWIGRLLLGVMARETAAFNAEVLDALAPQDGERVLEIGFGHGRTLADAAARTPGARFAGVDVSEAAARVATKRCRALIAEHRLELQTGDSAALPWEPASFDAAYSVHTMYFWPDAAAQLAEIRRVLRAGARFVLGFRERSDAAEAAFPAPTYRFYSTDETNALLAGAGFGDVDIRDGVSGPGLRIAVARARAG
ncbi:MAG TPA: class I SAM-dependent methyltransferase [Kofleriaceae bacterium]|nr:class I SAM-dependent methyltransferase [Kofleriaceae bacterium]